MQLLTSLCTLLATLVLAQAALALPIVSVSSPAVVQLNDTFSVDITISAVEAGSPLNGFEFDLVFDSSVLTATSVVDGGFMLAPVFVVQNSVGALTVEFAEVSLLPFGATGAGVLATIVFEAVGAGISDLDLQNVILAAPFGIPITPEAVNDGAVTVAAVIPEPTAAALYGMGVLCVVLGLRRSRL